ncbi:hypothetical protein Drorol1_Dr00019362 [Drosera rotundifolia]
MRIYRRLFCYPPRASSIRAPIVTSASPVDPFTSHHFGYGGLAGSMKVVAFLGDDKGNGGGREHIKPRQKRSTSRLANNLQQPHSPKAKKISISQNLRKISYKTKRRSNEDNQDQPLKKLQSTRDNPRSAVTHKILAEHFDYKRKSRTETKCKDQQRLLAGKNPKHQSIKHHSSPSALIKHHSHHLVRHGHGPGAKPITKNSQRINQKSHKPPSSVQHHPLTTIHLSPLPITPSTRRSHKHINPINHPFFSSIPRTTTNNPSSLGISSCTTTFSVYLTQPRTFIDWLRSFDLWFENISEKIERDLGHDSLHQSRVREPSRRRLYFGLDLALAFPVKSIEGKSAVWSGFE